MTPRHQGIAERGHQDMMRGLLILMQVVIKSFPQEWPALIPVVEFLLFTERKGTHGFSALDLFCAWAPAELADSRLSLFEVPDFP